MDSTDITMDCCDYETNSSYSDDFWMEIFAHLDAQSLCRIAQTCYTLYQISEDKVLWSTLLQQKRGKIISVPRDTINHPKEFYRRKKDFETITEALKAVSLEVREKIYLSPGVYKETLVLDKPVDIIGEGPRGAAVVEGATANTILSNCTEGLVSNILVRQVGHWFCIDVEKGSLRVEDCDITNTTLSAIKIGKEASPFIINNKICDTNEAGVAVFGGSGVIEGNEFCRNRYGSIEIVYASATPIIKANRIHHNKGYGIHVHTQSRPIIQGNHIYENESDGISCWGTADPYVTGNKIYANRGDGIYIHEDGKGTFEKNEIFAHKLDGMRVSKSSPTILSSSIHNNEGDGIRVVMSANPTLKGNKIFDNNRVGIHVYRDAGGLCMENHIYQNKNAGIQVYCGGKPQIIKNKIEHNKCSGIYVSDRASVQIQNNDICYNGDCGLEIVSGAQVSMLQGNHIHHNKNTGFAMYQDTQPASYDAFNSIEFNGRTESYDADMMDVCDGNGPDEASMTMHNHNMFTNYVMREGRAVYPREITRGTQPHEIVSFLAEKAIQNKCCTYTYTKDYYHAQHWYECRTCTGPRQILGKSDVSVCEHCAKTCHIGHDLSPRKFGHFYCDCDQTSVCKGVKESRT